MKPSHLSQLIILTFEMLMNLLVNISLNECSIKGTVLRPQAMGASTAQLPGLVRADGSRVTAVLQEAVVEKAGNSFCSPSFLGH